MSNMEKITNNNQGPEKKMPLPSVEVLPKTQREKELETKTATEGQIKFYDEEIARVMDALTNASGRGLNTKGLEKRLEDLQKMKEKAEEDIRITVEGNGEKNLH